MTGGHNNYWSVTSTVVRSGAVLSNNTHSHLKGLILDGGELASTGSDTTWGGWMLDQDISVTANSVISAQRVAIANASNVSRSFDVATSATLNVTGTFENANTTTANGLIKAGDGTMELNGTNSYTGPTAVNAGKLLIHGTQTAATGTLTVAANATLGGNGSVGGAVIVQANGTLAPGTSIGTFTVPSATINGKLAMELDGASADRINVSGNLDITNATLTLTGTPTAQDLVIASFGSLTGSAFAQVTGLPNGYQVTYDLTNNQIKLSPVSTGFAAWIGLYTVSDPQPQGDPDLDGIANLLEYVLGGNPSQFSTGILPEADLTNDSLVFTFHRRSSSADDTTQIFQYGSNLTGWTDLPVIQGGFISISNNLPEPGMDEVIITIPAPGAPMMFGRLKVSRP